MRSRVARNGVSGARRGCPRGPAANGCANASPASAKSPRRPSSLIALFVVIIAIAGGVAYLLVSGDDEGGSGGNCKQAAAKVKPSEIDVTVLNGTSVAGLAATFGDEVEGKGFNLGAVTNSSSSFEASVVMFKPGHKMEARKVAKQLGIAKLQPMNAEIQSVSAGADVAVIVGEDNAEAAE